MSQVGSVEAVSAERTPVAYDSDMLRDYGEAYTDEELLDALEALRRYRADHLLHCHTEPTIPPEERKQALYDYCAVAMAEERLKPGQQAHNPYEFPEWLVLAQAEMAAFIMEDIDKRQVLAETHLFDEETQSLHNLANSVSAAIVPSEDYEDRVFVAGILTGQVRPWVLPKIRADELTLT